jgi:hypothetical protein
MRFRYCIARLAFLGSISAILASLPGVAMGGSIYVDGDDTNVAVNDGAFLNGTDTTTPSEFSTPELIKHQGDETLTSDARVLSAIPFIVDGGISYFQIIYDQMETPNTGGQPLRERVILTELSVYVGPDETFANAVLAWTLDPNDQVIVNDQNRAGGPFAETDSPHNAGGDVSLNIPFSAFPVGTMSDDFLFFRAAQTESNGGGDEWVVSDSGTVLPAGTSLPEPCTGLLALTGVFLLTVRRGSVAKPGPT